MQRRRFLAVAGVGAGVGLAGCALSGDRIALQYVEVVNEHDAERTVETRVHLDGGVIHEQTVDVPAGGDVVLECGWPAQRGEYRVGARFPGEETWTERDLTLRDEECTSGTVLVESSGDSLAVEGDPGCGVPAEPC